MTDDSGKKDNRIHIALIPDGNRRYAEQNDKPPWYGHMKGAKRLEEFLGWCMEYEEIGTISIFALSTENLRRSGDEVRELWNLYKAYLERVKNSEKISRNHVKVNVLGNEKIWRSDVRQAARDAMRLTAQYSRRIFNIMLSYGSHFEIADAFRRAMEKGIEKTRIARGLFEDYMMVSSPVDLIIRTGDQYRLSNFMLYQSAYAEIYFSKTMWPAFTREEFRKIIEWYFHQQRKFGR